MAPSRNIRLVVEYDGTNYAGWQRQKNSRTVQGELEAGLARILREKVSVTGAGRTDAGVHARGQVASFRTHSGLTVRRMAGGLNGVLPEDIVVRGGEEADEGFNARSSAKQREYSYLIARERTAIGRSYAWYVPYRLDTSGMEEAARLITAESDFSSFCTAGSAPRHHRCAVRSAGWRESGATLMFEISADRFLRGMVRALVGTMVEIGRGRTSPVEFARIFAARDRTAAGPAAPARGLVLERVRY